MFSAVQRLMIGLEEKYKHQQLEHEQEGNRSLWLSREQGSCAKKPTSALMSS